MLQKGSEVSALQFANEMMMQERLEAVRSHEEQLGELRKEVRQWEEISQETVNSMKQTV